MTHPPIAAVVSAVLVFGAAAGSATAQTVKARDRQDPQEAKPVIVTATRVGTDPFDVPYSASQVRGGGLATRLQARTTPEALREMPGISVQKTGHGQGSPKIRGQTGFHTLLLVDGIRINDSTWRSGNVEYWNHIDPFSFDRFEVVRGPSAVLWGSDAVAGVGHAFQKGRRKFALGTHHESMQLFRYSSAEDSFVGRLESQGNLGRGFGWHLGFSYRDYGDLEAGEGVGTLRETGHRERDGDLKLTFNLGEHERVHFAAQQNHLDDVPRTHSTVNNVGWRGLTPGSDLIREHDHRRQLYYLRWEKEQGGFFDAFRGTVSYKNRYEREHRLRSSLVRQFSVTEVETLGLTGQFDAQTEMGHLVWGADWYHDFVDSSFANSSGTVRNRGAVAGDADYDLFGVYVQDTIRAGASLDLLLGARWSYAAMSADDVAVSGVTAVDHISDNWNSLTGSARLLYRPADTWRLFGGFSQGFRAPNLSDTTRFDVARSGEQEVPATGLKPEKYYSFEVGGRVENGDVALQVTGYYTIVRDQIARFRTGNLVNGLPEVSKSNVGDGWIAGFEIEGAWTLTGLGCPNTELFGFVDYVDGRIDQLNNAGTEIEDRLPKTPPPSGMLGLRWRDPQREFGAEVFARMAYHVNPSRYTQADRNNTQRIPPDGLPGYAAFGIRSWYEWNEHLTASIAIENVTDADYRVMDSGLQEPGTNLIITLQSRF